MDMDRDQKGRIIVQIVSHAAESSKNFDYMCDIHKHSKILGKYLKG